MDFNNTGAMRSPFSPRVRQSITGRRPIGLSSAKKSQSMFMQSANEQAGDVIYKTPLITVETYGLPLPVMVTEALTFGSSDISVRMSECGWCWVVTGRRILTWPHLMSPDESSASQPAGSLAARELTLPQTDLAHKADLVMVFYSNDAQMPSCVGVSPEGVVRFWPSVGQEGAYCDVSCELAGQECDRLVAAQAALLLATTTCTLVLLAPGTTDGRQTVTCRTLRPPSGWLGGIGRRVSLMFFGSMPAHAEPKLVGVVSTGGDATSPHVALVAGGPVLQVWRGPELHEHSLRRALAEDHLLVPPGEAGSAEIAALDVRAAGGELLLLLAVTVRAHDTRYAVAHVNISDAARPAVRAVRALRGAPDAGAAPRLLPLGHHALLYTSEYIALASSMISSDKVEYVSVSAEGDRILGAEVCGGVPLLFSRKHGVLLLTVADSLVPAPSACDSPAGSPSTSDMYDGNLSLFEIDPHEINTMTTDACGKLKTAFLFHVRREVGASRALLQELFPRVEAGDVDGAAARTALAVAREMLDDAPAGDPRWQPRAGRATSVALGASAALQVAAQLADKRRAFAMYVDFLRGTGLMARAGALTGDGGAVVAPEVALGALAERLAAAAALRAAHTAPAGPAHLIDAAVERVAAACAAEDEPEVAAALAAGALAPHDVVYRRVTRAPRVLAALARAPPPQHPPAAAVEHATATLALLANVMTEMHKVRAQWGDPAPPALGPRALLPALLDLVKNSVSRVSRMASAESSRAPLLEAAASLAAAALHEAAPLQADPRTVHIYERMRRDLILPFLEEGQTERAAALADKFQDFELLVQLCVEAGDLPRLQRYIDKYEAQGMAEVSYSWLAQRGGRGAAVLVRGAAGGARLRAWLGAGPARAPLAALRALADRAPAAAATHLVDIAAREHHRGRMTTAASLAKLCCEAAGAGEEVSPVRRRAEECLSLSAAHAALPPGLRPPEDEVLSPEELVQLYIAAEDEPLTEYDYKQALDLTVGVTDVERRDDLRLKVWCASVRRDEWSAPAGDAARGDLRDKMFFRLVDLVHLSDADPHEALPTPEDLMTSRDLADLAADPGFRYHIQYGYETLAAARG